VLRTANNFCFVNRDTFIMVELGSLDANKWAAFDMIAHISPLETGNDLSAIALAGWAPLPNHIGTGAWQMETKYTRVRVRWPLALDYTEMQYNGWNVV
jgi:hypothetical protein